jgi:hypothetical protein
VLRQHAGITYAVHAGRVGNYLTSVKHCAMGASCQEHTWAESLYTYVPTCHLLHPGRTQRHRLLLLLLRVP